jgi:hypothetical protein
MQDGEVMKLNLLHQLRVSIRLDGAPQAWVINHVFEEMKKQNLSLLERTQLQH